MAVVLTFLACAALYTLVLVGLVKLAARAKRRGIASAAMSAVDEIWHPIAVQPQHEIRVERERVTPVQAPGDPLEGEPQR
ncbi:hypothetical protein [Actinophytocola xanthii]|uniref:Uncharacterized protein n=1 Tax=Actinophytocola xanthii TaxID=1912961 RepID=A0A1Q8CBV1_9PSEU|nr:hypothetical protein [Actinophytocola xanthii]OLF11854.1 hypothetical protein BU204_29840 [Actinophytocola xanthii]